MPSFVALYRGRTVAEAELIALSAEQRLVDQFIAQLTGRAENEDCSDERDDRSLKMVRGHNED